MTLLVKNQELPQVVSVLTHSLEVCLLARPSRSSFQICDRVLLQVVQGSKLLSFLVIQCKVLVHCLKLSEYSGDQLRHAECLELVTLHFLQLCGLGLFDH